MLPLAALLFALLSPLSARGQETNLRVLERLGLTCLVEAPDAVDTFLLATPDSLPYLRAALTRAWLDRGKRITSTAPGEGSLPTLRYEVENAQVSYQRVGRRTFRREIALGIEYTFLDADGTIRDDRVCSDVAVDTVRTRDLTLLEDPSFRESVGEKPPAGWMRRFVEPAVLVGAVAVGVFLFFSLRSETGS